MQGAPGTRGVATTALAFHATTNMGTKLADLSSQEMVRDVRSCDIGAGVPYDLTPSFLDELLSKHRIDYVIHGDDPCILPGAHRSFI